MALSNNLSSLVQNYISIRTDLLDDGRGQHTGFQTLYSGKLDHVGTLDRVDRSVSPRTEVRAVLSCARIQFWHETEYIHLCHGYDPQVLNKLHSWHQVPWLVLIDKSRYQRPSPASARATHGI